MARSLSIAAASLGAACGGGDAAPTAVPPSDIEHGRAAFVESCASCHTTRDAFDLAHFGFAAADIIRRARTHVDQRTAEDIAAYVQSLGVQSVGRDSRPFQPGTRIFTSDEEFWRATFGTDGWPASLTPATLRAINTRELSVSVPLPMWSSEADERDWLPEVSLSTELRTPQLVTALETYYAAPTTPNLLALFAIFEQISGVNASAVCYGEAATHTRPRDCFEARRWMSTLAGQHFMRSAEPVPIEVADLWWSTGQAAVTVYQREPNHPRAMVWGWLYLAYSFSPTRFNEDNSYLGQFLQSDGRAHLAAFAALRRLVDTAEVHRGLPAQRFWDAAQSISRSPLALRGHIAEFVYSFLLDWLATAAPLGADARKSGEDYLSLAHQQMLEAQIQADQLARITSLRTQLLDQLR